MNTVRLAQLRHWCCTYITRDSLRETWPYARHQLVCDAKSQAPFLLMWMSITDSFHEKTSAVLYIPNALLVLLVLAHWMRGWIIARNDHAWVLDYCRAYKERELSMELSHIHAAIEQLKFTPQWPSSGAHRH